MEQNNETAKENYDRSVELFKKQIQLKKTFDGLVKNRWQPLPEVQSVTEVFTDVQQSGEMDMFSTEVFIKLGIPEKFREIGKYFYRFKWMDGKETLKRIDVKNKEEEQTASYKIDFGHHKLLSSLKVVVKIKRKKFCGPAQTMSEFETNLTGFKKAESIKKNFRFEENKFLVTVWLDTPLENISKNIQEVSLLDIVYTPPPFKGEAVIVPKQTPEAKEDAQKKGQSKDALPQGVFADEIKDPDVQRNLWSCYYCK